MTEKKKYKKARERMVERQMRARGIRDERVLRVMLSVPRHLFVSPDQRHAAYNDSPLPISHQQTISQPYIVALMTELLELKGDERVLEVGTGSGYQAAVLAQIARKVYSLERIHDLAVEARLLLSHLALENIEVLEVDGTLGLPEHAPYDAIIITADLWRRWAAVWARCWSDGAVRAMTSAANELLRLHLCPCLEFMDGIPTN